MDLTTHKRKPVLMCLLMVSACLWLYGCGDELEPERLSEMPPVRVNDRKLYIIPDSPGYIDLYTLVKTQGTVRLDIVSQPRRGNLAEMGKGLFQYTPHSNFRNGSDAFIFHIYSQNNSLLMQDSVIIIVENNTDSFPIGFYPQNDIVYGVTGEVTIKVLDNDILGVDSTQVGIEIYRPDTGFPPHAGTATVVSGNRIRYTPGNNFNGRDSIFYKVFSMTNPTKSAIAKVVIAPALSCQFQLLDDNFVFETDTLMSDTVWLNIFQNDQLCDIPVQSYQFEILDDGSAGIAFYDSAGGLGYRLPEARHQFKDSVIYRLCYQQRCETARAYVEANQ